jgi:potassium uptake TrkH family protein
LNTLQAKIKNYLYDHKDKAVKLVGRISYAISLIGAGLTIYRYGFLLSDPEIVNLFAFQDVLFGIYLLIFTIKFLVSSNLLDYLKANFFEALLVSFIAIQGFSNYLYDYKFVLEFFKSIEYSSPVLSYQHFLSAYLVLLLGLDFVKIASHLSEVSVKPATTFLMSFVLLILSGAGLLMLPAMTTIDGGMPFIDALFTSVSASCVTGLIVEDTGVFFTTKGHVIILFLIQFGGIGIVSFATFFATFLAKGVGLKHQSMIQDYLSSENLVSATGLLRKVILLTLGIEFLGAIAIFFTWEEGLWDQAHQFHSLSEKVFFSFFHSVSAFCNAGFSLFTDGLYNNDFSVRKMYNLHFVMALIIIFGGLGFTVIEDIFSPKNIMTRLKQPWRKWEIGTKMAVYGTFWLIVIGTIGFMILEFDQLTDRNIVDAFITSMFQSVTTRTAGFNTMDFGSLQTATVIMCFGLMFIGTAPGSTGGGLKITTFILIVISSVANIRRQERVLYAKRTISNELVHKAFSIFIFAIAYNGIAIFLLSITESDKEILKVVFEQISAFSTAGLSMGITHDLSFAGKCIIIVSMYLGRIGTLTLALALSDSVITNSYRHPNAHIMVG